MNRPATYRIIADAIRQTWLTPEAVPGERLPTERALETHFGVSRATISRALAALAAEGLIETRRGSGAYVAACSLTSELQIIGFIAPRAAGKGELQNPVLHRIYNGIERRAAELGYQAIAASAEYSVTHETELIEQLRRMGAKGMIVYPTYLPKPRHEDARDPLAQGGRDFPLVLTDIGSESWNRSMVVIDNFRLCHDLTMGLLKRGRERILFMHTKPSGLHTSVQDRQRGWEAALQRAGKSIPPSWRGWPDKFPVRVGGLSQTDVELVAQQVLALDPRPDAIIAWDDPTAIPLIRALQSKGVAVPAEIIVAGFDNYEAGRYFSPAFPTTQPDLARMGEVAVDLLDEAIRVKDIRPRTVMLSAEVVWRKEVS
ncbi:GntR family transcriptional regulator [Armatimonas sp.]|uniref:GntR family transcriptional regulator n=1 Tax=Armatimonas sp. TaxID=1872638 RepID=UPI00375083D2